VRSMVAAVGASTFHICWSVSVTAADECEWGGNAKLRIGKGTSQNRKRMAENGKGGFGHIRLGDALIETLHGIGIGRC